MKKRSVCCRCKTWKVGKRNRLPEGWALTKTSGLCSLVIWQGKEFIPYTHPNKNRPICPKCKGKS